MTPSEREKRVAAYLLILTAKYNEFKEYPLSVDWPATIEAEKAKAKDLEAFLEAERQLYEER